MTGGQETIASMAVDGMRNTAMLHKRCLLHCCRAGWMKEVEGKAAAAPLWRFAAG